MVGPRRLSSFPGPVLARFARPALLLVAGAVLFACATGETVAKKKKKTPADPGDDFYDEEISLEEGLVPTPNDGPDPFGDAPARPGKDAGPVVVDAGVDGSAPPPKVACAPMAPGDLAVVELMISSRAGSNDDGEWVEIQSTRDCWLQIKGLTITSPRGAATANTVTVTESWELPPHGTFVVADSADPAKNGEIPGKVFAWSALDVLKNDGDSVRLEAGATVIETFTYPEFTNLGSGRALAFPDDCTWDVRADWARWSLTFSSWPVASTKKGTPNARNLDVACY